MMVAWSAKLGTLPTKASYALPASGEPAARSRCDDMPRMSIAGQCMSTLDALCYLWRRDAFSEGRAGHHDDSVRLRALHLAVSWLLPTAGASRLQPRENAAKGRACAEYFGADIGV